MRRYRREYWHLVLGSIFLLACGKPAKRTVCPVCVKASQSSGSHRQPSSPSSDSNLKFVLNQAGIDRAAIKCNSFVRWEPALDRYSNELVDKLIRHWHLNPDEKSIKAARHHALGYLVRLYFDQVGPHNLGALALKGYSYKDEQKKVQPVLVFRSSLASSPEEGTSTCFKSLVENGRVRHVINLYAGSFPFQDIIEAEKQAATRYGISYADVATQPAYAFRQLIEKQQNYESNRLIAMKHLANMIREQILLPQGKPPQGNIYFHCAGGMHRSGMVFGVLQRCINQTPMEAIEDEYKKHVNYKSPKDPGGFEPLNLRFIREFDCQLLLGKAE